MKKAHYVWLIFNGVRHLTYYYFDEKEECWGFGFNRADGGGFIPEDKLPEGTIIISAVIGMSPEGVQLICQC